MKSYNELVKNIRKKLKKKTKHFSFKLDYVIIKNFNDAYDYVDKLHTDLRNEFTEEEKLKYELNNLSVGTVGKEQFYTISVSYNR